MDNRGSWSSCAFELEDIEIINHKTDRNEEKLEKWNCDQCSLFFLEKGKLDEHKKKHSHQDIVKCKYCNKDISSSSENRECYLNKKCETCEYKCTKCPKRFLRHSSLMNHEKKHTSPKTKRINRNKKVNGVATDNTPKALKRNHIDADDLEKQTKELKLPKSVNEGNSPKKEGFETQDDNKSTPSKISRRLSFKGSKSAERKNNCGVKSSKQPMSKNNSILEETCSDSKSNQSTIPCNSQTASSTINVLTNENVVNYKPFSCHVCGDTFASDNALLTHIRTHGENAIKSFKCKFCGDEFDDIYKMQYHLAICPLAEDELEFKQVIPTNIPTKYSGGISTPRKRGRPKKIREVNSNEEESNNESIPQLSSKRGNVKRRKEEDTENIPNEIVQNSLAPPNQSNDSPEKEQLSGPNTIGVDEDDIDLMSGDITEIRDYEPSDDRKKIHLCPFPQCDFKFTREKALLCHMRNHSDDFDDSLKCHKCDIPFDDIHALRQHINSCKGIKEEKDDDFSRADLYDSSPNRTLHRPKRDYFVCNQCGKSYQNQEKLNSHQCIGFEREPITKKNLRRHKCNVCQAEFQTELEENNHMVTHTRKVADHHCLRCFNYFRQRSLQQHKCGAQIVKSLRTLIELSIFRNNLTDKQISQMFIRTESRRTDKIHRGNLRNLTKKSQYDQLLYCKACKLSFISKKKYVKHHKSHQKKKEITCTRCNGEFSNRQSLISHESKRKKLFLRCSICSKICCNKISLTKHLNVDHGKKINKLECKICNITISNSTDVDHFMVHTTNCSVDKKMLEKYLDSEKDLDQTVSKYHKSIRNKKNLPQMLGCKSSLGSSKASSFATKSKCFNGFPSPSESKKRFTRLNLRMEQKNKENVPDNSLTEQSANNNLTEILNPNLENLIKPCYIPLVNMSEFESSGRFNIVSENRAVNKAPEIIEHCNMIARHIKKENDNDHDHTSLSQDMELKYYGHGNFEFNQSPESRIKYESFTNDYTASKDFDDSVVVVDHLTVHKCLLCSETFESLEFLKCHIIVHI